MKQPELNDLELVSQIMAGGKTREKVLRMLYENEFIRHMINLLIQNSGEAENIEFLDVFHDSLIVFDKNIRQNRYHFKCNLLGYLYSISRFVLLGKLRKVKRTEVYNDERNQVNTEKPLAESPESIYLRRERDLKLEELMNELEPKTAKVLELWQLSYSMKEIAEELNLSGPNMARKLKYHGYQKLLGLVKEEEFFNE